MKMSRSDDDSKAQNYVESLFCLELLSSQERFFFCRRKPSSAFFENSGSWLTSTQKEKSLWTFTLEEKNGEIQGQLSMAPTFHHLGIRCTQMRVGRWSIDIIRGVIFCTGPRYLASHTSGLGFLQLIFSVKMGTDVKNMWWRKIFQSWQICTYWTNE